MERKLNFLHLELQDIKNNKGSVTLQVRSIEHLQTWLKRDSRLQSSLLIKPVDVSVKQLQQRQDPPVWWREDTHAADTEAWREPVDFKKASKQNTQLDDVSKKLHMVTDVKKAIFRALMSSDDYLHAYEQLMHLNLKKTQ